MGAYGIAGDPVGMIQLAKLLQDAAAVERADGGRISGTLGNMVDAGPAATRFCDVMAGLQVQRNGAVTRLEALADLLVRAAAAVEEQQEDAKRRLDRLGAGATH